MEQRTAFLFSILTKKRRHWRENTAEWKTYLFSKNFRHLILVFYLLLLSTGQSWNVSLTGAAPSIIFVATKLLSRPTRQKYDGCDKIMFVATNTCLPRQKFRRDKLTFAATNTCLSRQNTSFVARDKTMLVAIHFCRGKNNFIATKVLSRPSYFCREKRRVLSRQRG